MSQRFSSGDFVRVDDTDTPDLVLKAVYQPSKGSYAYRLDSDPHGLWPEASLEPVPSAPESEGQTSGSGESRVGFEVDGQYMVGIVVDYLDLGDEVVCAVHCPEGQGSLYYRRREELTDEGVSDRGLEGPFDFPESEDGEDWKVLLADDDDAEPEQWDLDADCAHGVNAGLEDCEECELVGLRGEPRTSDHQVPDLRAELLDEAKRIVTSDRNKDYGAPEDNFRRIANLWMDYLGDRFSDGLAPHDVAVMMILMKVARIMESPTKRDHWLDIAGYAACGGKITAKRAA